MIPGWVVLHTNASAAIPAMPTHSDPESVSSSYRRTGTWCGEPLSTA
jgi:hypothetical protein